ncbi:MAG TPA: BrnT family toxin [Steroidobacteraceae bacterium]
MMVRFVWDAGKARTNELKHGVSFELARHVFDDPNALMNQDRIEDGEYRWQTLGMVEGVLLLLVAHTFSEEGGDEIIRIISARRADRKERKLYEDSV